MTTRQIRVVASALVALLVMVVVLGVLVLGNQSAQNADRKNNRAKFQSQLTDFHGSLCSFIASIPLGTGPQATAYLHVLESNAHCPLTDSRPFPPTKPTPKVQ